MLRRSQTIKQTTKMSRIRSICYVIWALVVLGAKVGDATYCDASVPAVPSCPDSDPRDLLFLVDGSNSMNPARFYEEMLDFCLYIFCAFNISQPNQAGLIVFNEQIKTYIPLAQYTHDEWFSQVQTVKNTRDGDSPACCSCCTPTAEAFDAAGVEFSERGRNVLKIAFTITDGVPSNNRPNTGGNPQWWFQNRASGLDPATYNMQIVPQRANALKAQGVRLFLVGVPDRDGKPPDQNYFSGAIPHKNVVCTMRENNEYCARYMKPPFPIVSLPANKNSFSTKTWNVRALINQTVGALCEILPTTSPTLSPTFLPTISPTARPSGMPSRHPSPAPSRDPTKRPTAHPSTSPTKRPTAHPSTSPTRTPSRLPSQAPTFRPSRSPTVSPTRTPSRSPTGKPSRSPSKAPSRIPTRRPTTLPSTSPSRLPSKSPSSFPSVGPTFAPSVLPTESPTNRPTSSAPSWTPSRRPTLYPTSNQPTFLPTESPTSAPSVAPSNKPSAIPTALPTGFPTNQPVSTKPTRSPSAKTTRPTVSPTSRPTMPSLEQVDLTFLVDRSASMKWHDSVCGQIVDSLPPLGGGKSTSQCWELFMRYILAQVDEIASVQAGHTKTRNLGWADEFPGVRSPAKGVRVTIIGFSCANKQKTPRVHQYSTKMNGGPVTSRERLIELLDTIRTTVLPDGGTCPGLAIEQAVKHIESTAEEDYPLQTVVLMTDGIFYDNPFPAKAVEGLKAYKALRFAVGVAVANSQYKYGLKPDEIRTQRSQLQKFVGDENENLFKTSDGWGALPMIAKRIAQDLPRFYFQGYPIPRNTWCGWRRLANCQSEKWRQGKCAWPKKATQEWGCARKK